MMIVCDDYTEALWGLGWPLDDLGASEAKRAKTLVILL